MGPKLRVQADGSFSRKGLGVLERVASDRTLAHRAMPTFVVLAWIEVDDHISAVVIAIEQGGFDLVMDGVDLVDVEVAGNSQMKVDVSASARAPTSQPMEIDP